jgi:fatty-acyl-CoA synthase
MQPHFKLWPKPLSRHLTVPATALYDSFTVSARRYPERSALIFYGKRTSYRELEDKIARMAGFLASRCAVAKGDRVLIDMQNCPQFVVAYYAILRLGAIAVPINPMNLSEEIAHALQDSGAQVAFASQEVLGQFKPLVERGLVRHVIVSAYCDELPEVADGPVPEAIAQARQAIDDPAATSWADAIRTAPIDHCPDAAAEDLALLVYTSGTTGQPKGCALSHRALHASILSMGNWYGWTADATALATAPFFHVTGMASSMNLPLFVGASIVLLPRWERTAAAALIQRHRVTHWTNVPTMVIDLLGLPDIDSYDLSSLCYVGGGGTAMPGPVAARLAGLTGLEYQEGWGLTEVAGPIHLNPCSKPRRQCLGIPVFDVDSRIIDPERGVELGPNQLGEIVTRGPHLFSGYWNNPEATREAFIELDGKPFFRTGDVGYRDDEGYFFIVDRIKRMINAAGFKIWPAEVEGILYRHPLIQEACVVGAKDPQRGETVKASVVLKRSAMVSAEEIIAWSREQMAYKIPRIVEFVDALPKSGTGKVQWRLLTEQQ